MADEENLTSNNDGRAAPESAPQEAQAEGAQTANAEAANAAPEAAADTEAAAELRQQLEASQARSAEYLDGWQRARAEFANYKRRVEKEQADAYQNATTRVFTRFLDVYDDFDRAMQERPGAEADPATLAKWVAGVELIHRKLQSILETEGVARMDAAGQPFDPQRHEAITHEENPEHESGHVIGVVRHGYVIGDRVLRPALVRVAK